MQKITYLSVEKLKSHPKNPRLIKDDQFKRLCESLRNNRDYFETRPILVNKDMVIFAGNQRFRAAKEIGLAEVPVAVMDIPEARQTELMMRDNRENGDWDWKKLAEFDPDLLAAVGFTDAELAKVPFSSLLDPDGLDEMPELPTKPVSKVGDIYEMGGHRLMCGDSANLDHVKALMGGETADLCFTDPPYNVDYCGQRKLKNKILNDAMPTGEFYTFLLGCFKNMAAVMHSGAGIYICHGDNERVNFQNAMEAAGFEKKECLIWVKNNFVMGRQDYHWRHEPILYGWKAGGAHKWYGDRKQDTILDSFPGVFVEKLAKGRSRLTISTPEKQVVIEVANAKVVESYSGDRSSTWYFNRPSVSADHPTQKPVALVKQALLNSSPRKGLVLDLFGGSGSTLIAAEDCDRRARVMELSPVFADVIVRRWEEATHKKAKRIKDGLSNGGKGK